MAYNTVSFFGVGTNLSYDNAAERTSASDHHQHRAKGDRLAVLEAMKMEHSLLAARDGVVAEVLAQPGDQVEAGAALVRLEAEEDA